MYEGKLSELAAGGKYLRFCDDELPGKPEKASYSQLHLRRCIFDNVGLKGLAVTGCEIRQCRFTHCYLPDAKFSGVDFTGTEFVNCDLRNVEMDNCILEYVTFVNCKLNYEIVVNNMPKTKNNLAWQLLRNLRLNAAAEGDTKQAIQLQLREFAASRKHEWDTFLGQGRYYGKKTGVQRLTALMAWLLHQIQRWTWGYGLKPLVLLGNGALLILIMAILFWHFDLPFHRAIADAAVKVEPSLNFFESLYVSAVGFSTLGTTDFSPLSGMGRLVQATEGIFGAIFIGLLAATLFRRMAR